MLQSNQVIIKDKWNCFKKERDLIKISFFVLFILMGTCTNCGNPLPKETSPACSRGCAYEIKVRENQEGQDD